MKKYKPFIFVTLILGVVLFLALYVSGHNIAVFNPKGTIALAEKHLIITATLLMLIVVIPVFFMTFFFAWRYRATNTKAKYTPDWQSNKVLEAIWWTIPAIIIVILATITWKSTHDLDPWRPLDVATKPITIQVVALDWKWLFIYPEEHIATVNFVEFPVNVPVNFEITADAPMNSFWIPQLAGQIYAMAGMTTKLHIMATEVGSYQGLSSNFSGPGFSGMKFVAQASSPEDFAQWVDTAGQSPNALNFAGYNDLAKPSKDAPVSYYSWVEQGLYDTIVMKFMRGAATTSADRQVPSGMSMPGMQMGDYEGASQN